MDLGPGGAQAVAAGASRGNGRAVTERVDVLSAPTLVDTVLDGGLTKRIQF